MANYEPSTVHIRMSPPPILPLQSSLALEGSLAGTEPLPLGLQD